MHRRGVLRGSETVHDAVRRTATALLEMDVQLTGAEDPVFKAMVETLLRDRIIAFGTALLANGGLAGNVTASCTVLPILAADGYADYDQFAATSRAALNSAMGTGYDLSELELPDQDLPTLNSVLNSINLGLKAQRRRPVASMATLRANHPRIREFIKVKREVDFTTWRFNLSLCAGDDFFQAVKRGSLWPLVDAAGNVTEAIDACTLLNEIADCAHYCGEPGIVFIDRLEADNPTPQWRYLSTAPCAEVAMAPGEACHFSYVNLSALVNDRVFDWKRFVIAVQTVTRLLDAAIEITVRNAHGLALSLVNLKRRIGVGLTGFADTLIQMQIPYDDTRAVQFASKISELLDYATKFESVNLARSRGPFPAFGMSEYRNGLWTRRKLPRSTGIVESWRWDQLFEDISKYGIRHSTTTAMPPAETPSAVVDSSTSLEPLFSLTDSTGLLHASVSAELIRRWGAIAVERRQRNWLDSVAALDAAELEVLPHLKVAGQIQPLAHLAIQAAFQSFLDDAVAKTINLPAHATIDDVREAFCMAYEYGLKGVAVFRDGCLAKRGAASDKDCGLRS